MLLCTRNHFIKSLPKALAGEEGPGSPEERRVTGEAMLQRIKDYATDESGLLPGPCVLRWNASISTKKGDEAEDGTFSTMVDGQRPRPGQRVVYVDGGFDLFSSGHIEFLRQVSQAELALGRKNGWYNDESSRRRKAESGEDYGPAFIIAGVHDDEVINRWKGVNYPIMNIFERGLCVLQCRVSQFFDRVCQSLICKLVHLQRSFLCPLYTYSSLPPLDPLWSPLGGISRAYIFHASHLRPVRCSQRARHLSGNQRAYFPACQRR